MSRNIFAHRLLLLLATIDYCNGEELPPYMTSKSAGARNLVGDVHRSIKFEIPSGQLDAQYNPAEACPANSHVVKVAAKVWDYKVELRVYVSRDRQSVVVTRAPPALGLAVVRLDVICSY